MEANDTKSANAEEAGAQQEPVKGEDQPLEKKDDVKVVDPVPKGESAIGKKTVPNKRYARQLNSEMKIGKEVLVDSQSHANEPRVVDPGQDGKAIGLVGRIRSKSTQKITLTNMQQRRKADRQNKTHLLNQLQKVSSVTRIDGR